MHLGWLFVYTYIYIYINVTSANENIYVCLRRHTLCNEGKLNGGIKSGGKQRRRREARVFIFAFQLGGAEGRRGLAMKIWKRYCAPFDRFKISIRTPFPNLEKVGKKCFRTNEWKDSPPLTAGREKQKLRRLLGTFLCLVPILRAIGLIIGSIIGSLSTCER